MVPLKPSWWHLQTIQFRLDQAPFLLIHPFISELIFTSGSQQMKCSLVWKEVYVHAQWMIFNGVAGLLNVRWIAQDILIARTCWGFFTSCFSNSHEVIHNNGRICVSIDRKIITSNPPPPPPPPPSLILHYVCSPITVTMVIVLDGDEAFPPTITAYSKLTSK